MEVALLLFYGQSNLNFNIKQVLFILKKTEKGEIHYKYKTKIKLICIFLCLVLLLIRHKRNLPVVLQLKTKVKATSSQRKSFGSSISNDQLLKYFNPEFRISPIVPVPPADPSSPPLTWFSLTIGFVPNLSIRFSTNDCEANRSSSTCVQKANLVNF